MFDETIVINDAELLERVASELAFTFDGDHGTLALVGDISFPGLANGDFSNYDAGWYSSSMDGSVSLAGIIETPEPSSSSMVLIGVCALLCMRVRRSGARQLG